MSTVTLERPTTALPTVARADILLDLLIGASGATGSKNESPMFRNVYLSAKNYVLTARATDRYRLIVGTTKAIVGIKNVEDGDLEEVALEPNAIKSLKLFLTGKKMTEVTLTVKDGQFTVSQLGQQVTVNSTKLRDFPTTAHLLEQVKPSLESGTFHLNLKLLASFAKVPTDEERSEFRFNSDAKAVRIEISHDSIAWECLLMPMRKPR